MNEIMSAWTLRSISGRSESESPESRKKRKQNQTSKLLDCCDFSRSNSKSLVKENCAMNSKWRVTSGRIWKGRFVRYCRQHSNSLCICSVIVFFPILCIYVGYSIGLYFMPTGYRRFPDPGVIVDMSQLNYSWYNSHNVTIDFVGGLGNQMFQYASLYGIGKANGLHSLVSERSAVARIFRSLKCRRTVEEPTGRGYSMYLERKPNAFDARTFSLNFMKNIRLDGFFQSWRYFDHVQSDLRKQFSFRAQTVTEVNNFLLATLNDYSLKEPVGFDTSTVKFIGIHIRRGDFLESYNVEKGYTVADGVYISKAMRYFKSKFGKVIFVVCSDDMEWSKSNAKILNGHVVYSQFKSAPYHDMCLLSRCNHTIITVGTFGWWGAWLAGGETVYYRDYPKDGSPLRDNFRLGDYYPSRWIAM